MALVHGDVSPEHIADNALKHPEIQRLSSVLTMGEDEKANAVFPKSRLARADITLKNGQVLASAWFEPKWDPSAPPTQEELTKKFHDYATPVLGDTRTQEIFDAIMLLENTDTKHLFDLLSIPPEELKIHVS